MELTSDYLKALDEQRKEFSDNLNVITPNLNLSDTDKFNKINDELFAHCSISPLLNVSNTQFYSSAVTNTSTKNYITITNNSGTYTIKIDFSYFNESAGRINFIGGKTYRFISTNNSAVDKQNVAVSQNTQTLTITTTVEPRYFTLTILSSAASAASSAFSADSAKAYVMYMSCFNTTDSGTSLNSAFTYMGAVQTTVDPYYQISEDGILSLAPEYRGAGLDELPNSVSDNGAGVVGSKHNELPEILVIPQTFHYAMVSGLAEGMFFRNQRVKKIALPIGTATIPSHFCNQANSLEKIYNTKDVVSIGDYAFLQTKITRVDLSAAASIGESAFGQCRELKKIVGGSNVQSIGSGEFVYTPKLKNIDTMLDSIKAKGSSAILSDGAMYLSSVKYDWEQLSDSVAEGTNPTPYQWNSNSYPYWVSRQQGEFIETINRTPTKIYQSNPDFKDVIIGSSIGASDVQSQPYNRGCALITLMHAYCGIRNYAFETPMQVEQQMLADATALGKAEELKNELSDYAGNITKIKAIADTLGLHTEIVEYGQNGISTYEQLVNRFYDELQVPLTYYYISLRQSGDITDSSTHAECCTGVTANGDIVILNSDVTSTPFTLPPQNIYLDRRKFLIIREGSAPTES